MKDGEKLSVMHHSKFVETYEHVIGDDYEDQERHQLREQIRGFSDAVLFAYMRAAAMQTGEHGAGLAMELAAEIKELGERTYGEAWTDYWVALEEEDRLGEIMKGPKR